jgi:hypothetical protein
MSEEFKYIKPKSRESILKSIVRLSLEKQFIIGIENNIPWLVQDCIDRGVDVNLSFYLGEFSNNKKYLNYAIRFATVYNFIEIVRILIKHKDTAVIDQGRTLYNCLLNEYYELAQLLIKDKRIISEYSKEDLDRCKLIIDKKETFRNDIKGISFFTKIYLLNNERV